MTSVVAALFLPAASNGLPPLGGRLFVAYRIAWRALLALAVATAGYALFEPGAHPLILGLRLTKSLVLITVSTILFRRRRTDPVAAMLGLSFLLWTSSSSVDFAGTTLAWPILLDRCRFLLFAFALLLFPDGQRAPRWTRAVAAAILLVFLIGILEALAWIPTQSFLPLAIGCVMLTLTALLSRYKSLSSVMAKQQLKWVALGLVTGIALILSARAGAAVAAGTAMPMAGTILLEGLFQLGIVIIALGFLTSLLRYRLYDAETAISRSAAYAALTLALVAVFAASESIIQTLGQRYFGSGIGDLSGGIAAAIAAVLLTPLHSRISNWAEQHFQHDLAVLKQELPDLLITLSAGASIKRLAAAVLPRIEQAVQATRVALVVDGSLVATQGINLVSARRLLQDWEPSMATELIGRDHDEAFPLHVALRCPLGSVRGWLLLGPRPDGSLYGKDDIDALTAIAPPLQRTLVLVAEREIELARQRRIIKGLNRSMAVLSNRLDRVEQI